MRINIIYISKLEFFYTFKEAFFTSITEKNIQKGFAGAGFIPYDLERVISKLNIRIRTLIPPTLNPGIVLP